MDGDGSRCGLKKVKCGEFGEKGCRFESGFRSNGMYLARLMTGDEGTLGVITEVTPCLKQIPEHSMLKGSKWSYLCKDDYLMHLQKLNHL